MKLYLSSFRMGERSDELLAAIARGGKVAVVSNALDYIDRAAREAYAAKGFDPVGHFRAHGFDASGLDLRKFFSERAALREVLQKTHLVWAVGGNAFLLRRAMRQSGFDQLVDELSAREDFIYGGWSAGAVVAGPTLRGIELMDDPSVTAPGYQPDPIWDGLDLVDYAIVPHFQSEHPEAQAAERAVAAMRVRGQELRTLRDGEVIVV